MDLNHGGLDPPEWWEKWVGALIKFVIGYCMLKNWPKDKDKNVKPKH